MLSGLLGIIPAALQFCTVAVALQDLVDSLIVLQPTRGCVTREFRKVDNVPFEVCCYSSMRRTKHLYHLVKRTINLLNYGLSLQSTNFLSEGILYLFQN